MAKADKNNTTEEPIEKQLWKARMVKQLIHTCGI
jgi:hypothetical protein